MLTLLFQITFPVCCSFVDDWVLVDEQEISEAVYTVLDQHHKVKTYTGLPF